MLSISLSTKSQSLKKLKSDGTHPRFGLSYTACEEELHDDIDKGFILNGLQNGFDIIDIDTTPTKVHCDNHLSAQPGSPLYDRASKQILHEIGMGNYEVVSEPPDIRSPLGVLEKPDGGVRLIHDCSMPPGRAVNDYSTEEWHLKFAHVDDAAAWSWRGVSWLRSIFHRPTGMYLFLATANV